MFSEFHYYIILSVPDIVSEVTHSFELINSSHKFNSYKYGHTVFVFVIVFEIPVFVFDASEISCICIYLVMKKNNCICIWFHITVFVPTLIGSLRSPENRGLPYDQLNNCAKFGLNP